MKFKAAIRELQKRLKSRNTKERRAIAVAANLSPYMVDMLLSGKQSSPTLKNYLALMEALDVADAKRVAKP